MDNTEENNGFVNPYTHYNGIEDNENDKLKVNLSKIVPPPINFQIHSNTGELLGKFFEKNGALVFEGRTDEAAQEFVNFICTTFNDRINHLIDNK